jgi:hypothetical protein
METPRRRSRGSRIGYVLAGCAALFIVSLVVWWNSAQEMPAIVIPTPVMPNPNAFDTFNSACAQMLDATKIGSAIAARHTGTTKEDRDYTWAEKEKFVTENAAALSLLRQGLNQSYVNPPLRSFYAVVPYYARYRAMARLFALESRVRAHRGDYGGAARSGTDAMEFGEEVPHGATVIGGLVGEFIRAMGRRALWENVDHLNADQARAAIQRLEHSRAKHVPFFETMQEEKWATQAGLLEILRKPNGMSEMVQTIGAPEPGYISSPLLSRLAFLVYSKRRIMGDYTRYVDAEIARMKLPYGTRPPARIPADPWVEEIVPIYDQAYFHCAGSDTQDDLVELALALRAYRQEHHGAYPASLGALAPAYLARLPIDPFGGGATPYHYRLGGATYLLYSVGPDGKDDGGAPIDSGPATGTNPSDRYAVKADSKGDIVAGRNVR